MKQFGQVADDLNGVMKKLTIMVMVWSGLVCCADVRGEVGSGQTVNRKSNSLHGLFRASNPPDTNELRRLLEAGAEIDAKDQWGTTTALFMAVQRAGDRGKGGPLNEKTVAAWTPIIKFLLDAGANPNLGAADRDQNRTPLMAASDTGLRGIAELLMEYKANINAEYHGMTALACAASRDDVRLVELLLSKGADINRGPTTPLHMAARDGAAKTVAILLSHGADANVRNKTGQTPEQWAREIYDYSDNKWQIDRIKAVLDLFERHRRGSKRPK